MTEIADSTTDAVRQHDTLAERLMSPCDVAGIAFFRMFFGATVLAHVWRYFSNDLINYFFGPSPLHLTCFGFEWVHALDLEGMRRVYYLMAISACGVALGLLYRISAAVLFATFTYAFLAEAGQFQNHYYLISLIAFLLIFIPAHRSFSLDSVLVPDRASGFVANWCRLLLMFQIAVPYVFGGIAKLNSDWLHGFPVGMWISGKSDLPAIGPLLDERWMHWFISYAGLVIDLAGVPMLLRKQTRIPALCILTAFHLSNSVLFEIDVFPWMSILCLSIFCSPSWPRCFLRLPNPEQTNPAIWKSHNPRRRLTFGLIGVYIAWQLLFPLRHFLYPGDPGWTEEGQQFAWRMMLRRKEVFFRLYATDGPTGETLEIPVNLLISPRQVMELAISPDQMTATAPFFAERARAIGMRDVAIRTVTIVSLNGRKPQLLVDPDLDLLTTERSFASQPWILPLMEPLREEPWDVPSDHWPEVLGIQLPRTVAPGQREPVSE